MSDIRKRVGKKGTTYQVRYPSKATKSGYAFATFATRKEALAFVESGQANEQGPRRHEEIRFVSDAADLWLKICEKEGLNGREPVTAYTYKNYEYRAQFIRQYQWQKEIQRLSAPDIVSFRSWLLNQGISRDLAGKVLSSFHSLMKEMTIRGIVTHNVAVGVSIRSDSRYQRPPLIPSKRDVIALLRAADELANAKNQTIAKPWQRYRPMLYLAVDSGMRPQEYLALARGALEDGGVRVERAVDGSGHKITVTKTAAGRRFIELSADTLAMVRHYANKHGIKTEDDLVFPAANGKWLSRRNWQRRGFNVACERAGLMATSEEDGEAAERPKYRPYDLRHFFASMLIEKKLNLKKIQTLMGHTNIETTLNVYGHLLEDEDMKKRETGLVGNLL